MTFDDYERLLNRFADELAAMDGAWEAYVPTLFASSIEAGECVNLRQAVLTEQDSEERISALRSAAEPLKPKAEDLLVSAYNGRS